MGRQDSFCMRLRAKRKKAGKSQADFATDIGMTRTGYEGIEHGVVGKSFMKLPAIARALGCRIDDLFPEMDALGAEKPSEGAAPEPETATTTGRTDGGTEMYGRRLKSMRTPELLAAHDALRAAKTWFNTWAFIAPCPICGRKKSAVEVRQDDDGRVRCCCKHCGAGKAEIYRAVGMAYKMDGQQTNGEEKRDMSLMCKRPMGADEIYGVNQCTTCVHYRVRYFGDDAFYGCEKRNQYMSCAIWNRPDDDPKHPCEDYCADMPTLQANMDRLERYIEEITQEMNGYRIRLDLLKAIEQTHGAAHQTESHSPKTEAEP